MDQRTNTTSNSTTSSRSEDESVLVVIPMSVAVCAFVVFLVGIASRGYRLEWLAALAVFILANFAFLAMLPAPETVAAGGSKETPQKLQFRTWLLLIYCFIIGLGFNWVCVFLWFSRRYDLISAPVLAVTALVMAFYVVVALLAAWLTGRNWRKALMIAVAVSGLLAGIVLRLGLLR